MEAQPGPAAQCRLTEDADSISDGTSARGTTSQYKYDEMGNQVTSSSSYNEKFPDGSSRSSSNSKSFQYDKDGFLSVRLTKYDARDRNNSTLEQNTVDSFTYDQGRLTRTITNYTSTSTHREVLTYAYDQAGNLQKSTDSADGVFLESIKYDYSNETLFKITKTNSSGTFVPYFEVNSQGQFTKTIEGTREYRYQYDAEGELIRQEGYDSGKPTQAVTYEYDKYKNPDLLQYPVLKGQPRLTYLSYINAFSAHNIIKASYFKGDATGQWVPNGYGGNSCQYNAKGYPETILRKSFDQLGNIVSIGPSSFYTYSHCD